MKKFKVTLKIGNSQAQTLIFAPNETQAIMIAKVLYKEHFSGVTEIRP